MSNEAFAVVIALVMGPLFGLGGWGALHHGRRYRRATLRTQGWQVSLPGYDDESTTTRVRMFWYVHGRRFDGDVQVKVAEVERARGTYALLVDPQHPDRAFAASDRPTPVLGVAATLYGLASAVYLLVSLLRLAGVRHPVTEAVGIVTMWIVGGGLALVLVASMAGALAYALWTAVKEVVLAVPRLARGDWKAAGGGLLLAVMALGLVALAVGAGVAGWNKD